MPELPEVETIKTAISSLINRTITDVTINRPNIRLEIPKRLKSVSVGQEIMSVERRAKYILITLKNKEVIVIHLGMSGRITLGYEYVFKKHDHVVFKFDDGQFMAFNDPRRFGFLSLVTELDLGKLGIEPLSDEFDFNYILSHFKNKNIPIKTALLDQEIIAGLGNIYVIESLFLSKISPLRKASDLSISEAKTLCKVIKEVLKNAITAGGTTLKDYRQANGTLGYFQNKLLVYGKEGLDCPVCKNKISRIIQGGRSTFYCTKCQK